MSELLPGPETNRRVGEAMGAEPAGWVATHPLRSCPEKIDNQRQAERVASWSGWTVLPVYPAYSAPTGGAWEACWEWLETQYLPVLETRLDEPRYVALLWSREGNKPRPLLVAEGPTRALAVCAAVLAVAAARDEQARKQREAEEMAELRRQHYREQLARNPLIRDWGQG